MWIAADGFRLEYDHAKARHALGALNDELREYT